MFVTNHQFNKMACVKHLGKSEMSLKQVKVEGQVLLDTFKSLTESRTL